MFFRPRRPLLGAAMIGGIGAMGYAAGRAGQRNASREQDEQERIAELESQQAPAPAAATDIAGQLQQLAALKSSGALTHPGVRHRQEPAARRLTRRSGDDHGPRPDGGDRDFDEPDFDGDILREIDRLNQSDVVRLIDLLVVRKHDGGSMQIIQRSDLSPEEAEAFGATVGALVGFGAASRTERRPGRWRGSTGWRRAAATSSIPATSGTPKRPSRPAARRRSHCWSTAGRSGCATRCARREESCSPRHRSTRSTSSPWACSHRRRPPSSWARTLDRDEPRALPVPARVPAPVGSRRSDRRGDGLGRAGSRGAGVRGDRGGLARRGSVRGACGPPLLRRCSAARATSSSGRCRPRRRSRPRPSRTS